jgi:DNA topoisomerase-3
MSNILVIAEKPSMGRDIAKALGAMLNASVRSEGNFQRVGNYTVVGAQGHLFSLASPEEYGEQFQFPWKTEVLPVLPDKFVLEPNFQRANGKVVNSDLTQSIRARLKTISELIKSADQVIHAGDPDREGCLIVDDILREFKFKGPVQRLWLHAQTMDGIQDAFSKMKDNKTYANLGVAALARRESDWAIGMNATRAYSSIWWKKGHKGILNIGRVVTPVVGMIVQREKDIDNFVPINHYRLLATLNIDGYDPYIGTWVKPSGDGHPAFDPSGKLVIDKTFVQTIKAKCEKAPAQIISADKTDKRESPPLLFSLIELQKMAAKMGYAPDEILAAAQKLYDTHKLTSYPRTECQYAPESEQPKARAVINAIAANFAGTWSFPAGYDTNRKSGAWNDAKLAEHFAIIPLASSCPVSQLTKIERDVYMLICRQYLAQFFPHYEYMASTLVAQVKDETFKATGRTPTVEGWRVLFGGSKSVTKKTDPDSDEQDWLPNVKVGEQGTANPIEIQANNTKPPVRFTAITLLVAMEKAYLFVTDPKVKAMLKEVEGIGTAATRATIIARAVSTGLAAEDRSGKVISYRPTAKAQGYVLCVAKSLTQPDLTAWLEGKLEDLAKGDLTYEAYREMLAKLVNHIIKPTLDGSALIKMPRPEDMPEELAAKRPRKAAAKTAPKRKTPVKRT